uniref:Proteasome-activating nucleotidase n=1 Tax=Lygus hesperus TaxID=30085 RepID=A0A0A9XQJ2_LYGHE
MSGVTSQKPVDSPCGKRPRSSGSDTSPEQPTARRKIMLTKEEEQRICNTITASIHAMMEKMMEQRFSKVAEKSDISNLASAIQKIQTSEVEIKAEMVQLKKDNLSLKRQLDALDRRTRQDRLAIRGLPIKGPVELKGEVKQLLLAIQGVPAIEVRKVFQITARTGAIITIVQLGDESVIPAILQNASTKWKSAGVSITRDMSAEARLNTNRMLRLRWELRQQVPDLDVKLSYDRLIVKGEPFEWRGDLFLSGNENGAAVLKNVTGLDMSATIRGIVDHSVNRPKKR